MGDNKKNAKVTMFLTGFLTRLELSHPKGIKHASDGKACI